MSYSITRLAQYGDFIVYLRGSWAKRERLPLYFVSRESDGKTLEEFRRRMSAINWARDTDWHERTGGAR